MMLLAIFAVLLFGMGLSSFFSGTETGFYRVSKTRLALDALSGDWVARGLIVLSNNPGVFVATTLVGNNVANYLSSWAIVLGTTYCLGRSSSTVELVISVLMTPVLFIYGDLMPKNLFYDAPNRLLRISGPLFLFFTTLFSPLVVVLWILGRLLEKLLGVSPERSKLRLVRRELQRVFAEGHDAGVLQPSQRQMADGMFQVATLPLSQFLTPPANYAVVRRSMSRQEMIRIARRRRAPVVLIQDDQRNLQGYVHVVDLHLKPDPTPVTPRPLLSIPATESVIAALHLLQDRDEPHATLVGPDNRSLGLIEANVLAESILNGGAL